MVFTGRTVDQRGVDILRAQPLVHTKQHLQQSSGCCPRHDCQHQWRPCTLYEAATVQLLTHTRQLLQPCKLGLDMQHDEWLVPWQVRILQQAATRQHLQPM